MIGEAGPFGPASAFGGSVGAASRPAASQPRYVEALRSGLLADKVRRAAAELQACRACPRACGVDRSSDEIGACRIGRDPWVASAFPHFGEEDPLRGWRGSGTIFFSGCNLACVFCQNDDISSCRVGSAVSTRELADTMLSLQRLGCHNINLVTPEHVVPQLLPAIAVAAEDGLRVPIVYNTSAYDAVSSLELLDGVVDIYMPDFKVWDPDTARRWLGAGDYPEAARAAIREMHRQVGDLVIDGSGLAVRGMLVRHLVMPGATEDARSIFRFLCRDVSPDTYVNIMAQYRPAGRVLRGRRHPELAASVAPADVAAAYRAAVEEGLRRFDGPPSGLL